MNHTRSGVLSFVCLISSLVTIPVAAATQSAPACPTGPASPGSANSVPPGLPTPPTPMPSAPQATDAASQKGFLDQDLMTGDWGGLRKTLEDDGMKLAPTYYGEVYGNPSGGMRQGTASAGLLDVELDLDLDLMSGGTLSDLTFHANAMYVYGTSLSESFIGDFSNTSDIVAYNSVRLQELWLQKTFWDKRLSIKAGNIAMDTEFFQSASASLFNNGTFGTFDLIANNIPNPPVYPVASPGVRIQFLPTPETYLMAGVFGMDNSSNEATNNQNGLRFAMTSSSGMLIMSEAGYLLNQAPTDKGLQGTYRLGSFVHTANYDTWQSQAEAANGTGNLHSAGASYGIYGVLDQQIYSNNGEIISLFVRSGGAPSNTNFVDWYAEGGFNFTGFIPGRTCDIAGIAVGRSHVSKDFSDSEIAEGENPFTAETVLEATYKCQLAPWWSIQPDFQYIVTPGGQPGVIPNATVIGLRTTVAF